MLNVRRMLTAGAATAVLLGVSAPSALAACATRSFAPVYSPFRDSASYTLAPDGGLEGGADGWTLSGASLVADNPHLISEQAAESISLELTPGTSATTPPICVSSGYPSVRMFGDTVRHSSLSGSTLRVEVLYTDATRGRQTSKVLGTVPDTYGWDATRKMALAQGQLNIKPDSGGDTYVRYRFTPLYGTTWRIDDVYVDPRFRY